MATKLRESIDKLKVIQKNNSDAFLDVVCNIETRLQELE